MPSRESFGSKNMWYSFNYGPVHFVNINTETDFPSAPNDAKNIFGWKFRSSESAIVDAAAQIKKLL